MQQLNKLVGNTIFMNKNIKCVCGVVYDSTTDNSHFSHYDAYYRIIHTLFKAKAIGYTRYSAFLVR